MFDFYFILGNYSISINPKLVQFLKWVDWDTTIIFEWKPKEKSEPKPKPEPINKIDDDDIPIPF
ncbi:hypothetical protein [Planktothrix sp.]|uniref:hypothetical protein n=1 Tax=Planktothrix sp. TaxID=3088171 RepID=UPI0038D4A973